jgi:hypothetical protein
VNSLAHPTCLFLNVQEVRGSVAVLRAVSVVPTDPPLSVSAVSHLNLMPFLHELTHSHISEHGLYLFAGVGAANTSGRSSGLR